MDEIVRLIDDELNEFAKLYYGAPICDELIEFKKNISIWLLKKEQCIKDYYWTRDREEKLTLTYTYKSFKLRVTFYSNADIQLTLDHGYSHSTKIDDKKIKKLIYSDPGYVYFIESEFGWKIGKTRDIIQRNRVFAVKLPFEYAIRYIIKTHDLSKTERLFHDIFKNKNINGEWFLVTAEDIRVECEKLGLKPKVYHSKRRPVFERKYLEKMQHSILEG